MFVSVAIDLALDRLFTYAVPVEFAEKLKIGQLLRVPFSGRVARGFAISVSDDPPPGFAAPSASEPPDQFRLVAEPAAPGPRQVALKPILGIEDESPFFTPGLLDLVRWIASYTAAPLESVLHAALPAAVLKPSARPRELLFVDPVPDGHGGPPPRDHGAPPPRENAPHILSASLRLCASAGKLSANHEPRTTNHVPLTPRQAALLADIRRVGGGWLASLVHEFSCSPAMLKALAAKGLVEIAPRVSRRDPLAGRTVLPSKPLALNPSQAAALEVIGAARKPVLLFGVTGSGKTEVYLQAIARILEEGKGAIVLVPEIALTPQTVQRFAARFGPRVAVLHSALSDGERYDEWHRIRTGEARVVVGPRSAVFAPVARLGLIVVDEEHDTSYKQEDNPRYNARDVAVMRGVKEGATVVLGSATPSLESWLNAKKGKYVLAPLPSRVCGHPMPEVHIVDLAEEAAKLGKVPMFSSILLEAIRIRLDRGEQSILFLNRRGYSRSLVCPVCGHVEECPDCSVAYTYHIVDDCLRCHVCGGWRHVPTKCPSCGSPDFKFAGIGTQRAEIALQKCFPRAKILRMDADAVSRRHSHDEILSAFRAGKADILLGTQMIAKGLDFPNVTLVGVLNADTSLNLPDFRASERTYQLLAQVSGRAGRADLPGEVYIQTFNPKAPAVAAAASHAGFEPFAEAELADRESAHLPPYCRLATIVLRSKTEALAESWSKLYSKSLAGYAARFNAKAPPAGALLVSEAVPAALAKAEGWFRCQIVIRGPSAAAIAAAFRWIRAARPVPPEVRLAVDIDAINLL